MVSRKLPLIVGGIIVSIPVIYLTSCSVISGWKAKTFERVHLGNTEQQVIDVMGKPTDRETNDGPQLIKYGAIICKSPCAQRLWYSNRISLVGEAWLVELDASGHVVHTAHLTSP